MELKKTLLMPKTDFEMRGNLAQKEPLLQKQWDQLKLYQKLLAKNKGKPSFILHDGPPYANGDIHVGHALNKILKDIVVRERNMSGFYSPYIPGWDTHGLPIESVLSKKGVNRKTTPLAQYRNQCGAYALEQVEHQKQQFKRLAIIGDFDNPYLTLDKKYEASQIRLFGIMALNGLIYKGKKAIYWSPSSETALAEAEIEYQDVTSHSIYVKFKVSKPNQYLKGDESFVIWTTTPWTLPANLAISLNPNYEYSIYETNRGVLIFLEEFLSDLTAKFKLEDVKLRGKVKGRLLEKVITKHPFYNRDSIIILGEHVLNDAGTGCVHTAPGHGEDDFIVGQKYGLEPYCPVDSKGFMMPETGPELAGLFYEAANAKVLEILKANDALMFDQTFVHSYPHDWRTKKPIIFRATDQWFFALEKIKTQLLQEIKNVKWYPEWGELRLSNMMKDRSDWCISRQRAWGVPITIVYGEDGTPILEKRLFDHFEKLIAEHGSNIWFEKEVNDLLPKDFKHRSSPNGKFFKETDIMDVWFDSGISHSGALVDRGYQYPFDLYLEGSDQYRGWFNSSLITGTAVYGKAPYKTVVSHGFVLDGKGNKMSKSLGNVVDPNQVANVYGADILRLWVASVDYQSDVRISDDIVKQITEQYRKIRNTLRFLHGNLSDGEFGKFNPKKDQVKDFELIDLMILEKLKQVVNTSLAAYQSYDYPTVTSEILNFMAIDLSSFYLDLTKDILYCDPLSGVRRRQVQTVIYQIVDAMIRLLTPIIPHTTEELFKLMNYEVESAILLDMVQPFKEINYELLDDYGQLIELRTEVLKALENARSSGLIGSAQEACITLEILDVKSKAIFNRLPEVEKKRLFIVSTLLQTQAVSGEKFKLSNIKIDKDMGVKCERCWNRFDAKHINQDQICPRCQSAIKHLEDK
jgi:isoleucyl-tRNA synthetase